MGWANLILGAVSLIRLATENLSRNAFAWSQLTAFDATVATLWTLSGLCLVAGEPSLMIAAMAAGAAAGRSLISAILLVPRLAGNAWDRRADANAVYLFSDIGSRVLHYGLELLYWPIAWYFLLQACQAPRPRWHPDPQLSTGCGFAGACVLGGTIQAALIAR